GIRRFRTTSASRTGSLHHHAVALVRAASARGPRRHLHLLKGTAGGAQPDRDASGRAQEKPMNRQTFLATAAAAGLPAASALPAIGRAAPAASLTTSIKRLNLRHTWTTTMSSSQY